MFARSPIRLVLLVTTVWLVFTTVAHARTVAVVIGIDKYDSPDITQLAAAVKDARSFADVLKTSAGALEEDIKLLTSDEEVFARRPNKANIVLNLKWAQRAIAPGDNFLLYYAGHGITRWGKSYVLPMDANTVDADVAALTSLSLEDLQNLLGGVKCAHQIIILDCCRNDPERGRGVEDNTATADFVRDVQIVGRAGHEQAGAQSSSVLFSCSEGERAFERTDGTHGIFTHYLVEGLQGAAARGGEITFSDLAAYVETKVPQYIKSEPTFRQDVKQTPWHRSEGTGQVTIARPGQAPPPPTAIQPTPELGTKAVLEVRGTPQGASVFVDGELKGALPCDLEIDLGQAEQKEVEVRAQAEGFKETVGRVTLRRGGRVTWQTDLQVALVITPPQPLPAAEPTQPTPAEPSGEPQPPVGGTEAVSEAAQQAYQQGMTFLNNQDFTSAVTAFSQAIDLQPDWAQAFYGRGVAQVYSDENELAIADFTKALELRPDWADAYNDRGMAYADSEQWNEALADFNKALELNPQYASSYLGRGLTYLELGDVEQARPDLQKALDLDPNGVVGETAAQALVALEAAAAGGEDVTGDEGGEDIWSDEGDEGGGKSF